MRRWSGYVAAVSSASVCLTLLWILPQIFKGGVPKIPPQYLVGDFVVIGAFLASIWIATGLLGLIPFVTATYLAKERGISSPVFFALAGLLTAAICAPLVALLDRSVFDVCDDEGFCQTLAGELLILTRAALPSGLVGGLAYWWVSVRGRGA